MSFADFIVNSGCIFSNIFDWWHWRYQFQTLKTFFFSNNLIWCIGYIVHALSNFAYLPMTIRLTDLLLTFDYCCFSVSFCWTSCSNTDSPRAQPATRPRGLMGWRPSDLYEYENIIDRIWIYNRYGPCPKNYTYPSLS